jgi:hypothetical protein
VTAQGHPRAIFKRAIERGNVVIAEATAREIGLSLDEALQLVLLYAAHEPGRPADRLLEAKEVAELGEQGSRKHPVKSRFAVDDGEIQSVGDLGREAAHRPGTAGPVPADCGRACPNWAGTPAMGLRPVVGERKPTARGNARPPSVSHHRKAMRQRPVTPSSRMIFAS